ncbi:MAG TPA: hypothetical protein VF100_12380, partial [Thermoanaerobaculia bacterium]
PPGRHVEDRRLAGERDRARVVLQFGDELPDADEKEGGDGEAAGDIEEEEIAAEPVPPPAEGDDEGVDELQVVELPEGQEDFGVEAAAEAAVGEEPAAEAEATAAEPGAAAEPKPRDLVLSGWVAPADALAGKPAILDVPAGRGRVILFAFNPLHRHLNHSDHRLLYNVILHWNDLP